MFSDNKKNEDRRHYPKKSEDIFRRLFILYLYRKTHDSLSIKKALTTYMKELKIKQLETFPTDFSREKLVQINEYRWSDKYTPTSRAGLFMIKSFGFVLYMESHEQNPKTEYYNYNDPVYTDSCLEFFAKWSENSDKYINMEINPAGTLLSCIGAGRENREPIVNYTDGKIFEISAEKSDSIWSVTAKIPFEMLDRIYGEKIDFSSGRAIFGNFYKCGDNTKIPHYGSWNPVMTERPDFHRPEYFGKLIIE